ncbi:MAG: phosphoserine phosphatase [Plesiomonas sp.]|uniref:phosphoserine phosphatase n=1 Tax=Plesiomonas sp. TaxID=2486279 RepID=UPI003F3969DF
MKDYDFTQLPSCLSEWSCFPLLLQGHESVSCDYTLGEGEWLLYGKNLDKSVLAAYLLQLNRPVVIQKAWHVEEYQIVQFAGQYLAHAAQLADQFKLDTARLHMLPSLHTPGLLVMDMDSTAIQIECIDEIATLAGTGPQVAEVTERAMRGELDFAQSLRQRVATLRGAPHQILEHVLADLPLMPGLTALVQQLQNCGWQVAIASGGFTYFAEHLQRQLGLCHVEANVLGISDNLLTGEVEGRIVDAERKATVLCELAERYQIPLTNTVGIGDGANDLKMLHAAGLGIAFHAKPTVQAQAQVVIRHADLLGVLCILSASIGHSL